jgi:hypothetical protein
MWLLLFGGAVVVLALAAHAFEQRNAFERSDAAPGQNSWAAVPIGLPVLGGVDEVANQTSTSSLRSTKTSHWPARSRRTSISVPTRSTLTSSHDSRAAITPANCINSRWVRSDPPRTKSTLNVARR